MIILKMMIIGQTRDTQNTRYSSLARSQNGPNQENLRTVPDTLLKQLTKCKDNERQLRWQGGHETLYKPSVLYIQTLLLMHDSDPPTE